MNIRLVIILAIVGLLTVQTVAQTSGPDPEDANARIVERVYDDINEKYRWEVKAKFPEYRKKGGLIDQKFSDIAKQVAMKEVNEFKKSMQEVMEEGFKPAGDMNFFLSVDYSEMHFDERLISILYTVSSFQGGAHPNSWSYTLNYDISRQEFLKLDGIFKEDSEWEKALSKLVVKELYEQQNERGFADLEWIQRGAGPKAENFKHWNATKKGISIMYDAYGVGPYAAGPFSVNIPYTRIPEEYRGDHFYLVQSASYINGNPPNYCRNGLWTVSDEPFKLARIVGRKNQRAHFYGDQNGGPENPASRRSAYLISGDEVIVKRAFMGFSCVWYSPRKGSETVGWIKTERLRVSPDVSRPPRNWDGRWEYADSDITIRRSGDRFKITGSAIWKGLGDNVHIGELDHYGVPRAGKMNLGDPNEKYACLVEMTRLGRYLIVRDNLKCGGVNVSFNGVYRRIRK